VARCGQCVIELKTGTPDPEVLERVKSGQVL